MERTVSLLLDEWRTVLEFAGQFSREIADYDDDEWGVVPGILAKIDEQLADNAADTPYFVPVQNPRS